MRKIFNLSKAILKGKCDCYFGEDVTRFIKELNEHKIDPFLMDLKSDRIIDYYNANGYIMVELCGTTEISVDDEFNRLLKYSDFNVQYDDGYVTMYDADDYGPCHECGEIHSKTEMEYIDGEYYCEDCTQENFFRCERCNHWHNNDKATLVHTSDGDEYWCEDCVCSYASRCEMCDEYYEDSEIVYVAGLGNICNDCRDRRDDIVSCERCGELILAEDAYEVDDDYYCESCYRSINNPSTHIRSYHHNPAINFHSLEGDEQKFIGTEVETEKGDVKERATFTWEFGNHEDDIYQMHDGSLDSDGIECITQPMTYAFWKQYDFKAWMDGLVERGARAHDTSNCGLHVHLSREWMGTTDSDTQSLYVGRMRQFLYDNIELVKKFARRSEERWCKYTKTFENKNEKQVSKEELEAKYIEKNKPDGCHSSRYQSINNENSDTIEFRIFRGTLNENTYRASVEFALRVVDYIITHDEDVVSWEGFMTYKPLPESMETYMIQRGMQINF